MNDDFRRRAAALPDLVATAKEARNAFVDVVTDDCTFVRTGDQTVILNGMQVPGGPVPAMFDLHPTPFAHGQLAERAGVPKKFYDRIRTDHADLWAHTMDELYPRTPGLYRTIQMPHRDPVLRAALSDTYMTIDNVDGLVTLLGALDRSGLSANECQIWGDLDTDRGQLRIRVVVPSIAIAAHEIVDHYKSPHDGRSGKDYPMIFAGLEMWNNECGDGAFGMCQRAVLEVCTNGMTRNVGEDVFRRVHIGTKLDAGVVTWSDDTRRKQLELVGTMAEDAIRQFISPEALRAVVAQAAVAAGVQIEHIPAAMAHLATRFSLTDAEADAVLNNFVRSGDTSVLGLAHAMTATAFYADDGDRQSEMETAFWSIVDNADVYADAA